MPVKEKAECYVFFVNLGKSVEILFPFFDGDIPCIKLLIYKVQKVLSLMLHLFGGIVDAWPRVIMPLTFSLAFFE